MLRRPITLNYFRFWTLIQKSLFSLSLFFIAFLALLFIQLSNQNALIESINSEVKALEQQQAIVSHLFALETQHALEVGSKNPENEKLLEHLKDMQKELAQLNPADVAVSEQANIDDYDLLIWLYNREGRVKADGYDPLVYYSLLLSDRLTFLSGLGEKMLHYDHAMLLREVEGFNRDLKSLNEQIANLIKKPEFGVGLANELANLLDRMRSEEFSSMEDEEKLLIVSEASLFWAQYFEELIEANTHRQATLWRKEQMIIGAILFFSIIGTLLTFYFLVQIASPIKSIVSSCRKVLEGDLTTKFETFESNEWDTLSHLLNAIVKELDNLRKNVSASRNKLNISVGEMTSTTEKHHDIILEQENTSKKITECTSEISDATYDLERTLRELNAVADATSRLALEGRTNLGDLEEIMQKLVRGGNDLVSILHNLNGKVQGIRAIMNTMVWIADQTNLLSLNTSLEASKVQVVGKGFSVIANEIKRLADQSAQATLTIEYIVEEIFSLMKTSVDRVQIIIEEILLIVERSAGIQKNFELIIDKVQFLGSKFTDINRAVEMQRDYLHGIQETLVRLQEVSNDSSRLASQFSISINLMREGMHELHGGAIAPLFSKTGKISTTEGDQSSPLS